MTVTHLQQNADIEPFALIVVAGGVVVIATLGVLVGRAMGRARMFADAVPGRVFGESLVDREALVDMIATRMNDDVEKTTRRMLAEADRTFSAHVQTGKSQIDHQRDVLQYQREAIDRNWHGVATKVTEELTGIKRLVADLQTERATQNAGLTERLEATAEQQRQLLNSTQRLNNVLVNKQARGQWGERMVEDILRATGLIEGVNYLKQHTTEARTRPDFTFLMPDGQHLNMDVKFPLESYVRYTTATSEPESAKAIRDFRTALDGHVRDVATREGYIDSATTVGYVLMFVANDAVYAFIHEHHRKVFDSALKSRVVICSPSTLFAMLSLVRQAADTIALERSSQEILKYLGSFTKQWERYLEQFELMGRHLDRFNNVFNELASTRRNQLDRQLDRINELKNRTEQDAVGAQPPAVELGR